MQEGEEEGRKTVPFFRHFDKLVHGPMVWEREGAGQALSIAMTFLEGPAGACFQFLLKLALSLPPSQEEADKNECLRNWIRVV